MKIVLIEDDIYLNTLICDVLISQGYEVDAYADGAKALKAIEKEYDCILLICHCQMLVDLKYLKK